MYICSHGSKIVGEMICLKTVIVPSMLPYSCLQLSICNAYAERGSLFLMHLCVPGNLILSFDLSAQHTLCGRSCTIWYIPLFHVLVTVLVLWVL